MSVIVRILFLLTLLIGCDTISHPSERRTFLWSDAILITKFQQPWVCKLVSDSGEVKKIIDAIRFRPSEMGSSACDWQLYFLKCGVVIDDAEIVGDDNNIRTSFGCFDLDESLMNVIKKYTRVLDLPTNHDWRYVFVVSHERTRSATATFLFERGYRVINDNDFSEYPQAQVELTIIESIPKNTDMKVQMEYENRVEETAIQELEKVKAFVKNSEFFQGASRIRVDATNGDGKYRKTAMMTIYFKVGTAENRIRQSIPQNATVTSIAIPMMYFVQVVLPMELTQADIEGITTIAPFIKEIRKYGVR